MRCFLLTVLLLSACTSAKGTPDDAIPTARVDGTFLTLTSAEVERASDASLIETIATACGGPCDRLYVTIPGDVSRELLQRLVGATAAVEPTPRLFVVAGSDRRIELAVGAGVCETIVGVRTAGASVERGGTLLPPDPTCPAWEMAICRGADQRYDWPRLRSAVGAVDEICVGFDSDEASELTAIHEALRNPRIRLVPLEVAQADIAPETVATVIDSAGSKLQWCLDGETAEEDLHPMDLTLRLAVHTDGTVIRTEVVQGVRTTSNFEACVADVVETLVFDPIEAPTTTQFTLLFEPGARAPELSRGSE